MDQTPLGGHTAKSSIICQHNLNTFTNKCIQDVIQSNATLSESTVPDIHSFLPFFIGHCVNIFIFTKTDPISSFWATPYSSVTSLSSASFRMRTGFTRKLKQNKKKSNSKKFTMFKRGHIKAAEDSSLSLLGVFCGREQGIDIRKVCLEQVTE